MASGGGRGGLRGAAAGPPPPRGLAEGDAAAVVPREGAGDDQDGDGGGAAAGAEVGAAVAGAEDFVPRQQTRPQDGQAREEVRKTELQRGNGSSKELEKKQSSPNRYLRLALPCCSGCMNSLRRARKKQPTDSPTVRPAAAAAAAA